LPISEKGTDCKEITMTIQSTQSNRKYFDEWAKDKSPLLATASLAMAGRAQDCFEFLQILKSGKLIEDINMPPIHKWLNLYRNHRQLYKGVSGALRTLGSKMSQAIDFYELIIEISNQSKRMTSEEKRREIEKHSPEELQQIVNEVSKKGKEFETWTMDLNNNDDLDIEATDEKEKKKIARKFFQTPEIIFYFRVWIPCFLLYGTYPPYLLRKARQGNDKAIEKLLRLDKSIIDDPKIKEIFHQSAVTKHKSKFNLIIGAIQKAPKVDIEIKTVKYAIAGLISKASIALGQELGPIEINRLFHAIARDSRKGIIDDDLVVSPEAFERAVERKRDYWQVNLKPDIK